MTSDCGFRMADSGLPPGTSWHPQSANMSPPTVTGGRHPQCFKGCRPGVTLTEVVVASALLVISIVPLLQALTTAHAADRALERRSWSLLLAQQELEWIRARCLRHYEDRHNVTSRALRDGYLCTVTDDGDPSLRTIAVSVGLDRNGDGILAADEEEIRLCTRLARPARDVRAAPAHRAGGTGASLWDMASSSGIVCHCVVRNEAGSFSR